MKTLTLLIFFAHTDAHDAPSPTQLALWVAPNTPDPTPAATWLNHNFHTAPFPALQCACCHSHTQDT